MAEITPEIIETVMEGIAEGQTLRGLARQHNFSKSAWYNLLAADDELRGRFARAREEGFDAIAEETVEIADDKAEDPASRRVRVDTRLKLLAKWSPKKYGDATTIKHADADGEKLPMDEVTRAARLAAIAAQINANAID